MYRLSLILLLLAPIDQRPRRLDSWGVELPRCDMPCVDTACLPLGRLEDADRLLERADHVFYGRVLRAAVSPTCESYATITLRVLKRWKGAVSDEITVVSGDPCGRPAPFAAGHDYLVAAFNVFGNPGSPPQVRSCAFPPLTGAEAYEHMLVFNERLRTSGQK